MSDIYYDIAEMSVAEHAWELREPFRAVVSKLLPKSNLSNSTKAYITRVINHIVMNNEEDLSDARYGSNVKKMIVDVLYKLNSELQVDGGSAAVPIYDSLLIQFFNELNGNRLKKELVDILTTFDKENTFSNELHYNGPATATLIASDGINGEDVTLCTIQPGNPPGKLGYIQVTGTPNGMGHTSKGINYLKLEEKDINNQCANPSKNGYVRMSFFNGPDAPSDSGHDSNYTQWIGMAYEHRETGSGSAKRYYDDRPMGYDYAQYYTTLNPGSYKLIFEGYCPTNTVSWKGCPECRDGSGSYTKPDNAVIHLYSHNHPENHGENLLNFTEWCNVFKTYSVNSPPDNIGVNGINGGSGEYTENSIIMTKNSVNYWMFPLSYNYGGAGTIPQVGLWPTKQSNPYNRGYFIRFNVQSSSPISNLKVTLRKNTSTTVFVDEDITNLIDEDGNVEYHFVTTEKYIQFCPGVLLANNVEGETVTISNIGIYLDENGIVNYEIVPEEHSSERFIHQELPFTLTETDTLGLFFLRFVGSPQQLGLTQEWYSRFMIVDADESTEAFDITYNSKNYTGVSCWEPFMSYTYLSVKGTNLVTGETDTIEELINRTGELIFDTDTVGVFTTFAISPGLVKVEVLDKDSVTKADGTMEFTYYRY